MFYINYVRHVTRTDNVYPEPSPAFGSDALFNALPCDMSSRALVCIGGILRYGARTLTAGVMAMLNGVPIARD